MTVDATELLRVEHLVKSFPLPRTTRDWVRRRRAEVRAVDDVSFAVHRGEVLGIVGESGSGKSTLARCLVGLTTPDSGTIHLENRSPGSSERRLSSIHARVQIVFQDPYAALNPRLTIGKAIAEALHVHHRTKGAAREARVNELLELVGLSPTLKERRPRHLSGGQRQRAVIARALAVEPEVLIADEAVSALDVSVQAQILNLLLDLREQLGLTIVFISHQLSVVSYICDRVAVMRHGRFVEVGPTREVYEQPRDAYTQALLAAHPDPPRTELAEA